MQEARRDEPPPVAVGDRGPVERALLVRLALQPRSGRRPASCSEEHGDVEPDQRLRHDRAGADADGAPRCAVARVFTPVGTPAHSGHLIPTAVCTMQSVQIGRRQFEHATYVSRPGCR